MMHLFAISLIFVSFFIKDSNGFILSPLPQQHYHYQHHKQAKLSKNNLLFYSSSTNNKNVKTDDKFDIEIISEDPKCFLVHNMLSVEECEEYISRANKEIEATKENKQKSVDDNDNSNMKRSNAPEVSIQLSRLWPLPFLCLGAGIPPLIKLFMNSPVDKSITTTGSEHMITINDILSTAIPNISIALGITIISMFTITQGMKTYAAKYTRTSQSIALNQEQDLEFIRPLVTGACEITKQNWYQWEAPVITKYETDALFASHNDASPTKGSEWVDIGGQRIVTVITYLNTCQEGGGTKFDKLNFVVQPKQGSALVFFPADSKTLIADERTIHQSLPAIDEKFIVQLFGRCQRVPPPLGIPDSFT